MRCSWSPALYLHHRSFRRMEPAWPNLSLPHPSTMALGDIPSYPNYSCKGLLSGFQMGLGLCFVWMPSQFISSRTFSKLGLRYLGITKWQPPSLPHPLPAPIWPSSFMSRDCFIYQVLCLLLCCGTDVLIILSTNPVAFKWSPQEDLIYLGSEEGLRVKLRSWILWFIMKSSRKSS